MYIKEKNKQTHMKKERKQAPPPPPLQELSESCMRLVFPEMYSAIFMMAMGGGGGGCVGGGKCTFRVNI